MQFKRNEASNDGGALYMMGGHGNVSSSVFVNNKATSHGQDVASCSGNLAVVDSTFYHTGLRAMCTIHHGIICCSNSLSLGSCDDYSGYLNALYSHWCQRSFLSCKRCVFRPRGIVKDESMDIPWELGEIRQ